MVAVDRGLARASPRLTMLAHFRVPVGWLEIFKRTFREVLEDDVLSLAAELAYYFFLALFPALLFVVALAGFLPIENLIPDLTNRLAEIAPPEVVEIIRDQLVQIARGESGGLLTVGMLLTLWSSSAGMLAIINTLNKAYDIEESRPWWKVRLTAVGLTVALALFILVSFALVVVGPEFAQALAERFGLGTVFVWTWWILQWPIIFVLVAGAIGITYCFAPDAEQEWVWLTPGSVLATLLWVLFSLGFRVYVTNFADYNETYGAIGGVIVLLLWFYASGLAILIGAELNAEIERASPYGKAPGKKVPGEKRKIGVAAMREWEKEEQRRELGEPRRPVATAVRPLEPRPSPLLVVAGGIVAAILEAFRGRRERA
ncbi:MAG TPA: YihY/virulence factor BrkB family protein [Vicinamibacterales bacterium]|nr:YihY/virulence factor BrkB family protein [Vicinamibacterales bacterium]